MKKARLLLIIAPLVAGTLYLRSLASWRPKLVFAGRGQVTQLVFSNDGRTLLVRQSAIRREFPRLTSLDATHGFRPNWMKQMHVWKTQFFASNTGILAVGGTVWDSTRTLEAHTGKVLSTGKFMKEAVISPDGKWLAHHIPYPDSRGIIIPEQILEEDVFIESASPTCAPLTKGSARKFIGKKHELVSGYAFSPDGKTLLVGVVEILTGSTRLDFYDTNTWKRTRSWKDFDLSTPLDEGDADVQWSPDGRFLLSSWELLASSGLHPCHAGATLWRASDGKKLVTVSFEDWTVQPHLKTSSFQLQNDGRVLALSTDGRVFLDALDHLSLDPRPLLNLSSDPVITVALSPDGSYLVAGTKTGRVYWQRVK